MFPVQRAAISPLPIQPVAFVNIVKEVALACLKQLAVSVAMGIVVAQFVSVGTSLMISAIFIQCAVSLFFHSVGAFASYKIGQNGPNLVHFRRLLSVCEWFTGANFALFTGFNTQMLIHETGHALAIFSTYKKPNIQIGLSPFQGGHTGYNKTTRSLFGKKIGPVATTWFVTASGPALTLLVSSILLAIGLAIKEKYPQFGKYLICWSLLDFLVHAHYAYTALHTDPSTLSHDFVHLSILGLHPSTAMVGILVTPILINLGVQCWKTKDRS